LPLGTLPPPRATAARGDWTPFKTEFQFRLADLLYRRAEVSASNIDTLLEIWAESVAEFGASAPFSSHVEMHAIIDSSKVADAPWQCFETGFADPVDESAPAWMHTTYEVWYRDPETVVSGMLANPDFDGQFDLRPYIDLDAKGSRRWSNIMSGNIAWRHSVRDSISMFSSKWH
jgi:Plavaka transposase